MALRKDFYGWTYDDAVPAFVTTGTNHVVYRKGDFGLIDIDTLIASCALEGYNLAAPEIGEAPAEWLEDNDLPDGVSGAPGYGTGTDPEAPLAPANTREPWLAPAAVVTETILTCQPGIWYAVPAATLTYQWYRDGVLIPGETNQEYETLSGDVDVDPTISCVVTATNASDSGTATTNVVTVYKPPVDEYITVIEGGTEPVLWAYNPGDRIDSNPQYTDITNPTNYQTEEEDASINFASMMIGIATAAPETLVQQGDYANLRVTDDAGNERIWDIDVYVGTPPASPDSPTSGMWTLT